MNKPAPAEYPVHELIRDRWSPRAFSSESVGEPLLRSLLEAARWAASCSNEQPWRFLVARREDQAAFERLLSCLNEKNQLWAKRAGLLLLSVAHETFASRGTANRHAWHDVGLATAQLTLQATALGLGVHPMAGFSSQRARELCAIPEGFEPVAAIAVGYPAKPEDLPDDVRPRELGPRSRNPQADFAFAETWGKPL